MCVGKLAVRYIRTSTAKYDAKRIARQTPPEGVSVREFAYLDDGDSTFTVPRARRAFCPSSSTSTAERGCTATRT